MQSYWQIRSGLFQPRTCSNLIEQCLKINAIDGVVGHGAENPSVDENIRRSKIRWVNREKPFEPIFDRIRELIEEANLKVFGFNVVRLPPLQFTEYAAERKDFYDWHEDITWVKQSEMWHRKLSVVVQLSDPKTYEGGDFELRAMQADRNEVRTQGSVIVFPSFLTHRVTPVTNGVRYSLVGWMEGPKFI